MADEIKFNLETSLGKVDVVATDGEHVHIVHHRDTAGNRFPIVVNGVRLSLMLHLSDYGKGDGYELTHNEHGRPEYHHLSASKVDSTNFRDNACSAAARTKILAVMVAAMNEYKKANPLVFKYAEHNRLCGKIEACSYEIAELEEKLAKEKAEKTALRQQADKLLSEIMLAEKKAGK